MTSLIEAGLGMTVGVLEDAGARGVGVQDAGVQGAAGGSNIAGQLSSELSSSAM